VILLRITCGSGRDNNDEGEEAYNTKQIEGEFGAIYDETTQDRWRDKVCLWARQRTVGSR
jgi:hypothetical protein